MADKDEMPLKKLNNLRSPTVEIPLNGVDTPTKERIQEAVKEANDPRRLVSEPPVPANAWRVSR